MTRILLLGFACLQAAAALSFTYAGIPAVHITTPSANAARVVVPATPSADPVISHVEDVKGDAREVVSHAQDTVSQWVAAPVQETVVQKAVEAVPAVAVPSKEAVLSKVECVEEVERHHNGVPHVAAAEDTVAQVEETVRDLHHHHVPALHVPPTNAVVSQKEPEVLNIVKATTPAPVVAPEVTEVVNTAQTTASAAVPAPVQDAVQQVQEVVRQPLLLPAAPVPTRPSTDAVLSKVQTTTKEVQSTVQSVVPGTETVAVPAPLSAAIAQVHEAIRNLLASLPIPVGSVPSTDAVLSKVGGVKAAAVETLNKVQAAAPVAVPADATGALNTASAAVPAPVKDIVETVQESVRQPHLLSVPSTDSVLSKVADVKAAASGTLSNAKASVSAAVPVQVENVQNAVLSKVESVQSEAAGVVSNVQEQAASQVPAPVAEVVAKVQEEVRQPHPEATGTVLSQVEEVSAPVEKVVEQVHEEVRQPHPEVTGTVTTSDASQVEEVSGGSYGGVNHDEDIVTDSIRACFHQQEENVYESVQQLHNPSAPKVQPLTFEEVLAKVKANLESAKALTDKVQSEINAPVQAPVKEELRRKFFDSMRRQKR